MTARARGNMRWRTKLLLLLSAFAIAPMLAVAVLGYNTLEQQTRSTTLDGLTALAHAKAAAIDQFTDNRRRDVERMSSLLAPRMSRLLDARRQAETTPPAETPEPEPPPLKDAEKLPPDGPPPQPVPPEEQPAAPPRRDRAARAVEEERAEIMQTLGLMVWDQRQFEELLVISDTGEVLASTFDDHVGQSAASLEYFRAGRRATYLQPVFMSPITEQLTMVISTPIRNEHHETIGVMAARLNLTGFFRLINDYTGLGVTGETIVAKKIGDDVVFMAPTRHDTTAALARKVRIGSGYGGLRDATRGQTGRGEETDYRGKRVFMAWTHIPELEWGLAAKIDYDEATKGLAAARMRTMIITVAVMLLVLGASVVASRALVAPLAQLRDATEQISRGNFDVQIEIRSRDEIGELADSFERMVAAIKYFREHQRAEDEPLEDDDPIDAAG